MMINYAKKIKEYRETKFLTQEEFARELGVSTSCVTCWENGTYEPTIKVKKKLYQMFIDSGIKVEE